MMYCPNCRAEYRPGFTRCSDCDLPLVDELPPEPVPGTREELELVEVYMAGPTDAELIRSLLEGNDIPARAVGSGASGAYPLSVGSLGETRVYVRAEDEDRAHEVISEITGAPADPSEIDGGLDAKWVAAAVVLLVALAVAFLADARGF